MKYSVDWGLISPLLLNPVVIVLILNFSRIFLNYLFKRMWKFRFLRFIILNFINCWSDINFQGTKVSRETCKLFLISMKWIVTKYFNSRIYRVYLHWVKSVRVRSYSGLHFPAFGLHMQGYSVSLRIQLECGKIWTRITPNMDTFHAVLVAYHVCLYIKFEEKLQINQQLVTLFHLLAFCFTKSDTEVQVASWIPKLLQFRILEITKF